MDNRSNVKLVGNTTIVNNIGDGIGIYACKINGNNLQFKTLYATGNSISLISCENKIYISGDSVNKNYVDTKIKNANTIIYATGWTTGCTYILCTANLINIDSNSILMLSPLCKVDNTVWANSGVFACAQNTNRVDFITDCNPTSDINVKIVVF
jgi:hypothetical protein